MRGTPWRSQPQLRGSAPSPCQLMRPQTPGTQPLEGRRLQPRCSDVGSAPPMKPATRRSAASRRLPRHTSRQKVQMVQKRRSDMPAEEQTPSIEWCTVGPRRKGVRGGLRAAQGRGGWRRVSWRQDRDETPSQPEGTRSCGPCRPQGSRVEPKIGWPNGRLQPEAGPGEMAGHVWGLSRDGRRLAPGPGPVPIPLVASPDLDSIPRSSHGTYRTHHPGPHEQHPRPGRRRTRQASCSYFRCSSSRRADARSRAALA